MFDTHFHGRRSAASSPRSDGGFAAARVFLSVASPSEDTALPSISHKQEKKSSISQKSAIISIRELLWVTVVDNFIIPKGFSLYKKLVNYLSNSRLYQRGSLYTKTFNYLSNSRLYQRGSLYTKTFNYLSNSR
jgi:hypothetical protein